MVIMGVACNMSADDLIPSQQHLEMHFSVAGDWLLQVSHILLPHEGE